MEARDITKSRRGVELDPFSNEAEINFRRWFSDSQVIDADGNPLVLYHATAHAFDVFEPRRGKDAGFHFGSYAQARMRGGKNAVLLEVYLSASKLKRVKDKGQWTKAQLAAARREGYDGIVYLNRFEGMSSERVAALDASGMLQRLDGLSDREFKKLVPEAEDSFIVFKPTQIKSIHNLGSWSRTDPRFDDGGPTPDWPGPSSSRGEAPGSAAVQPRSP